MIRFAMISTQFLWVVASVASVAGTNLLTNSQGLQRVKILDFTLTLCPSLSSPNLVTVNLIRNLAEISVVDALQNFDWGNDTTYQYAGLAGVGNSSTTGSCTTLAILGGLVSFSGNSQVIPTESEVESIVNTTLSSKSFKIILQNKYPSLTAVEYQRTIPPTAAPSQSPHVINPISRPQENPSNGSGGSVNLGVIIGAAVGGVVGVAIVWLLLLARKRRSENLETSMTKIVPTSTGVQPDLEGQIEPPTKPSDTISEASVVGYSSRLGRMLSAAKVTSASNQNSQEVDTSLGSTREESAYDDDDDDNSYSSDFVRIGLAEPKNIHPVLSLESFEEEKGRHVLKKDMMISEATFPAWRTSPGSSPDESHVPCALQPTDLSAKALAAEWAATSLLDRVNGKDDRSTTTGEASDGFTLDDLWDPDDCETSIASQKSDPFLPSSQGLNLANRGSSVSFARSGSENGKYQIPHTQDLNEGKAKRSRSYNLSILSGLSGHAMI